MAVYIGAVVAEGDAGCDTRTWGKAENTRELLVIADINK